jgi:hypothetical protein
VVDSGRLVGIVSLKDLMHFLGVKLQLEDLDRHEVRGSPSGAQDERSVRQGDDHRAA